MLDVLNNSLYKINNIMKSKIVWFTGLSGAGKTTLSNQLSKILKRKKYKVIRIDGDIFRKKNNVTRFSKKAIIENNVNIINYVDKIQYRYDYIIVSVISPLKKTRTFAFRKFKKKYYEILTKCNIKTLIKRDTKKLYEKARKGHVKNLIGFNSNIKYEKSNHRKIVINTAKYTEKQSINRLIKIIDNEKV